MNYTTSQLRLWDDVGGPAAEEAVPVRDISIRLHTGWQPSKAYLASSKQALPIKFENGTVSVRVPKLDVFELLILE
jgi:hypothetical protein